MTHRLRAGALASSALALSAVAGPLPDPADPSVQVPRLERRSSLGDYRSFSDQAMAPWMKVHDEVTEAAGSGHHDHSRSEGGAGDDAHEHHESGAAAPTPEGHDGHADHGGGSPGPAGSDEPADHHHGHDHGEPVPSTGR
jgi:hypothetical protein